MMYLVWLAIGAVSGFVASLIGRQSRNSMVINIGIGILGALIGGFALTRDPSAGAHQQGFFQFGSLLTAVAGAAILLLVFNFVRRGSDK